MQSSFLNKESLLCILLTICLSSKAYNFTHITLKKCLSSLTSQLFSSVLCLFLLEIQSTYYLFQQSSLMVDFLRRKHTIWRATRNECLIKPVLCYSTYRLSHYTDQLSEELFVIVCGKTCKMNLIGKLENFLIGKLIFTNNFIICFIFFTIRKKYCTCFSI